MIDEAFKIIADLPRELAARHAYRPPRQRSCFRPRGPAAGYPPLKIAPHLFPRYGLAGGDNPGVAPLGRVMKLGTALFLFSLLGYCRQYETVRRGAGAFRSAGDALLQVL